MKADLVLGAFAIFCRAKNFSDGSSDSRNDSILYCCEKEWTYDAVNEHCKHLPWTEDLRGTSDFSFLQLYDYLVIRTSKFKHIVLKITAYKKVKAFQFFYEGFIRKIHVAKGEKNTFFAARVKASMKKCLHKVLVKLCSRSSDVCSAACTCPAGIGINGLGNCNHVGGILFALEDFNRRGLQGFSSPISCTSRLSSRNVPIRTFNPCPIDEVVIQKIRFANDIASSNSSKHKSFDPRAPYHRTIDEDSLKTLKSKFADAISTCGIFGFHKRPCLAGDHKESLPKDSSTNSSNIIELSPKVCLFQ